MGNGRIGLRDMAGSGGDVRSRLSFSRRRGPAGRGDDSLMRGPGLLKGTLEEITGPAAGVCGARVQLG
jgi:hypothetical protein